MARPEIPIDWKKVDLLLQADNSGTQIAEHFQMHYNTFYNKVQEKYKMGFSEYSRLKKEQGDGLLKAKQFEKAMKGDNAMLIWLGKVRLGQREQDHFNQSEQSYKVNYPNGNNVQVLPKELPTSSTESPQ